MNKLKIIYNSIIHVDECKILLQQILTKNLLIRSYYFALNKKQVIGLLIK